EGFMPHINRRNALLGAAGAAALGLSGHVYFAAPARASSGAGHFAYKIGDVDVIGLHDGYFELPLNDSFIGNAELQDVEDALEAGGHPRDVVPINFTQTLLKIGDEIILVDAGTGAQLAPTAGNMMDHLNAAGVDPASVTKVLVSHFHPDHIFGLMTKEENAQVFPNAQIMVPEAEIAFWTDPATMSALPENRKGLANRIVATLGAWDNVERYQDGATLAPGVTAKATHGHTPGHTAFVVSSGSDELVIAGDIANIPALFVANPGWHARFDMDKAKAEAARRSLFDQVIADKATIAGYHFGFPNAGTIEKDGSGYAFIPMSI
ncbi:MAG: MBL fold metallo-hydrolase, partial [Pseudomonadota bacterium]